MIGNPALGDLETKTGEGYFSGLISAAVTFILTVGVLVFFFWFLWGAITWITSGGDKAKTEAARNRVTTALIGIVLLIATWAILNLIESIFNVNITTITFSDFYIN